jgi:hypothetical protein
MRPLRQQHGTPTIALAVASWVLSVVLLGAALPRMAGVAAPVVTPMPTPAPAPTLIAD